MNICWVEAAAPPAVRLGPTTWAWQCHSCACAAGDFTDQAAAERAAADHCWAVASAALTARGHAPVPQWREVVTDPLLRGRDLDLVALLLTVAGFYVPNGRITPLGARDLQALVGRHQLRDMPDGALNGPGVRRRTSFVVETALEAAGLELAVCQDGRRLPPDKELPALVDALHDAGLIAQLSPSRASA